MSDKELVVSDKIRAMLGMATAAVPTVGDMATGAGSVPRISLRGKVFRAKIGEEERKLGHEIDVIIVGIEPQMGFAKTYYINDYTPDSNDPPDCFSTDGIRPDEMVAEPFNDLCRTCDKNQWGSAESMSGKKAKACADSKHLRVVLAEELMDESPVVYLLNVTVKSLKPFGDYGKKLAKAGIPTPTIVITHLSFDEDASVPYLEFAVSGVMEEEFCEAAMRIARAKEWENMVPVKEARPETHPVNDTPVKERAEPDKKETKLNDAVNKW